MVKQKEQRAMSFTQQREHLQRDIDLAQKELELLEQLEEIRRERQSLALASPAPAPKKKKPGRPPGSKNKEGGQKSGRVSLGSILVDLAKQSGKKNMKLEDFVPGVLEAGYKSKSDNLSNMIYQALLKLVKEEVLTKDGKEYRYAA